MHCLDDETTHLPRATDKLIWINALPRLTQEADFVTVTFHTKKASETIELDTDLGLWLAKWLERMHYSTEEIITFKQFKTSFEEEYDDIETLWYSEVMDIVREMGLLVL